MAYINIRAIEKTSPVIIGASPKQKRYVYLLAGQKGFADLRFVMAAMDGGEANDVATDHVLYRGDVSDMIDWLKRQTEMEDA